MKSFIFSLLVIGCFCPLLFFCENSLQNVVVVYFHPHEGPWTRHITFCTMHVGFMESEGFIVACVDHGSSGDVLTGFFHLIFRQVLVSLDLLLKLSWAR